MDIKKKLLPECGELLIDHENVTAKILDVELNVLNCEFNYSRTVSIDTKDYNNIVLDVEDLFKLIELIEDSEDYFQFFYKQGKYKIKNK